MAQKLANNKLLRKVQGVAFESTKSQAVEDYQIWIRVLHMDTAAEALILKYHLFWHAIYNILNV